METFTIPVGANPQNKVKPSVAVSKFGDGYEQRTVLGINSMLPSWTVRITLNTSEALDFFERHNGVSAFLWENPLGDVVPHVCREWSVDVLSPTYFKINTTFDQVPA